MAVYHVLWIAIAITVSITTAFTVPTAVRQRTTFASSVYMSDAETASPELTEEEKASKRKVQRERHTLFVGNLPFETSDADVKALFEPHGKVDLVNIPRDRLTQKPRGFAFVDMGSAEELEAAIAAVDGSTFEDRQVRVTKSVAKGEIDKTVRKPKTEGTAADGTKKIYMGNIPFTASKVEITDVFSPFGDVIEVYIPQNTETGAGRGFAFITMNEADADKAIESVNGSDFGGRTLVVNEPLPPGKKLNRKGSRTKLYIGNLSFYTVAETLEDIFGEFGEIIDCYLPEDPTSGGSRGFGFVTMARDDALRAIEEIDGCEVDGRVIRVNEAQPKGRGTGGESRDAESDSSGSWDNEDNE